MNVPRLFCVPSAVAPYADGPRLQGVKTFGGPGALRAFGKLVIPTGDAQGRATCPPLHWTEDQQNHAVFTR